MVNKNVLPLLILAFFYLLFPASSDAQQEKTEADFMQGFEAFKQLDFKRTITCLAPYEELSSQLGDDERSVFLFVLGTSYKQEGLMDDARRNYEKMMQMPSVDSNMRYQVQLDLFSIYQELQDSCAQADYLQKLLDTFHNTYFITSGYYTDYALELSSYYYHHQQYDKTLGFLNKGLEVLNQQSIDDRVSGLQKNSFYLALGNAHRALKNYDQAALDFKNALRYVTYTSHRDSSVVLSSIGFCLEYANQQDSALVYIQQAEQIFQEKKAPIDIARVLNSLELGVILGSKGECIRALPYLLAAERGLEELGDFSNLAYVYTHLYYNFNTIGNKEMMRKYADLVKTNIRHVKNDDERIWKICYSTYASILEGEGKREQAQSIMQGLVKEEERSDETDAFSLSKSYSQKAELCQREGDYVQAETDARKALEFLLPLKKRYFHHYLDELIFLADILVKRGNVGEAISIMENMEEEVRKAKEVTESVTRFYSMLAYIYASIGNYEKLLHYSEMSCTSVLQNKGKFSRDYAVALINASEAYSIHNEDDKADSCLLEAEEVFFRLYGKTSEEYFTILHKRALRSLFDPTKREVVQKTFEKSLLLSKKVFGERSMEHAKELCWYGMFLLEKSEEKEGLAAMQRGLEILSTYPAVDRENLCFLNYLSARYHFIKDYESAYYIDKQYYYKVKEYLSRNFPNLIDWQREGLWTPFQNDLLGLIGAAAETSSSLYLKLAYNSLLLGKGLLLQSTNNISSAIKHSNNPELIAIHNRLLGEKKKLLNTSDKAEVMQCRANIHSLQRQELNNLTQTDILEDLFDIEWTDVCDHLEDGEVAIEFVSYPTQDCHSYVALVINNQSEEPLCIPLFNDRELEKFYWDDNVGYDYQNPDFYRVVWKRLQTYALKNATTVYFAPDGLLHKIAIENLVDEQGILASEKWEMHRLTSTRELVRKTKTAAYSSAVLYGGLRYNMNAEELESVTRQRAGVKNLSETRTEILDIKEKLEQKAVHCMVKTEEKGTEESFVALSSTGINVLHLATHGFFWTNEDEKEYHHVKFKKLLDMMDRKTSGLVRSGLLLSGVNATLQGQQGRANDVHDGILTAEEISVLDFENLNLVVLSACQTALGEVSGDGVFGLQRGFKLAGAKSLLMSLWKVDDYATRLLMTHFYECLIVKEMSKSASLQEAQRYVRSQPGFEDPEYWAGFILLDALD